MAVTSAVTTASPDEVWAVLGNGWTYSNWVVGTSHMRAVESRWPAAGSRLFHASGVWPAVRRDETVVEVSEPGRRLVLVAKARPFGSARVVLELERRGSGTRVTMSESPLTGPGKWLDNPGAELVLARRNAEALARLSALAEQRRQPRD